MIDDDMQLFRTLESILYHFEVIAKFFVVRVSGAESFSDNRTFDDLPFKMCKPITGTIKSSELSQYFRPECFQQRDQVFGYNRQYGYRARGASFGSSQSCFACIMLPSQYRTHSYVMIYAHSHRSQMHLCHPNDVQRRSSCILPSILDQTPRRKHRQRRNKSLGYQTVSQTPMRSNTSPSQILKHIALPFCLPCLCSQFLFILHGIHPLQ